MKYLAIILLFAIAVVSCSSQQEKALKRYDTKSGIVEYATTISGKMMGSAVSGEGSENLFFKDYGAIELREAESQQTTTTKIIGQKQTETESTHTINKLDKGESYFVDFDKKQIYAGEMGESMLKSLGGEKTGSEKFLGHTCEVWKFSGGKQLLYKGVMLKFEMTVLGITTITQATKADFGVSVPEKSFKLPDFPISREENVEDMGTNLESEEEIDAHMEKISRMTFEEWIALPDVQEDEDLQALSEDELRETFAKIQTMIKSRL